jgi:hypothetical protein
MIFENQFSRISELAQRRKEGVGPAAKKSSDERKRALRRFESIGERSGRHGRRVVTSTEENEAAAWWIELRPPTPNQPPEPTRLRRPFLFANAAHRVAHF